MVSKYSYTACLAECPGGKGAAKDQWRSARTHGMPALDRSLFVTKPSTKPRWRIASASCARIQGIRPIVMR